MRQVFLLFSILIQKNRKDPPKKSLFCDKLLFFFVIKKAVAIALVVLVFYLLAELLAHTFIFLCTLKAARAITARLTKPFLNRLYDLFIFIIPYLHLYCSIRFEIVAFGTYPTDISRKVLSFTSAIYGIL